MKRTFFFLIFNFLNRLLIVDALTLTSGYVRCNWTALSGRDSELCNCSDSLEQRKSMCQGCNFRLKFGFDWYSRCLLAAGSVQIFRTYDMLTCSALAIAEYERKVWDPTLGIPYPYLKKRIRLFLSFLVFSLTAILFNYLEVFIIV